MKNNSAHLTLFLAFNVILFLYHLFSLDISPIPWHDETFFASITASYNATGKFNLDIAPIAYNGEILLYGPVYFWITSFFTKILEFDIFSFRLAGVFFGFLCLIVFYMLLRIYLQREIAYITVIAFSLDPMFSSSMHSGRMETVALFFALTSIMLYFKAASKTYSSTLPKLLIFAFSGAAFSLALLTTPRIGVLLIALVIVQLIYVFKIFKKERVLHIIVFGLSLVFIYFIWLFTAFGNLTNFIAYYREFTQYVGSGLSILNWQIPLIGITLVSLIIGIIINYKDYLSEMITLSVLSILIFYIFVYTTGYYSTFILPFMYTIIGCTVSLLYNQLWTNNNFLKKAIKFTPLVTLLLFNVLFFSVKLLTLIATSEERNSEYITAFIKNHIPSKSKVIGDELYYFATSSTGSDFQYIHLFPLETSKEFLFDFSKGDVKREYYQRKVYDYDYIIWSDRLQGYRADLLELYQDNSQLIRVAEFKGNKSQISFVRRLLKLLNIEIYDSYNGLIYKRVK